MSDSYTQWRRCKACGHKESRELPKLEAAFEERREWSATCERCGSRSRNAGGSLPDLDAEILEVWAYDERLHLSQQDEDILMAQAENLPWLTQFVERPDIPALKRALLLAALCVLIHTPDAERDITDVDRATADAVINFLAVRRYHFDETSHDYLFPYIQAVAYPQIGLEPRTSPDT